MPGEPDSFIEINDFSPGIFSDFHATDNTVADTTNQSDLRGALPTSNGAATVENTYDCIADKLGALVPLPKAVLGQSQTCLPGGNTNAGNTNYMPAGLNAAYLLDAEVVPRSFTNGTTGSHAPHDRVYTLWTHRYDPVGGAAYKEFIQGRMWNLGSATAYDFLWAKGTSTVQPFLASGSLTTVRLTSYADN